MHQSRLLTLIGALNKEEIRWLRKFVRSPFYNSNEHIITLFEYIRKYYPNLEHTKLSKEIVYRHLFPRTALDLTRLRLLMHRLAVLTEDFMIAMRIRKDTWTRKELLLSEFWQARPLSLLQKRKRRNDVCFSTATANDQRDLSEAPFGKATKSLSSPS